MTLYAFVFGELPFWDTDSTSLFQKIAREPLRFPSTLSTNTPSPPTGMKDTTQTSSSIIVSSDKIAEKVREICSASKEPPSYKYVKEKLSEKFGFMSVNTHKGTWSSYYIDLSLDCRTFSNKQVRFEQHYKA